MKIPPVLIAHSYFLQYDAKQEQRMEPYPPLGTLLAAAMLRKAGFDVIFFDAMLSRGTDAFADLVRQTRPRIVAIVEDNFNYLTKMCTTRMREAAFDMIASAKSCGARVVVNGSDATDRSLEFIRAGADAVIVGEPELTLTELVTEWTRNAAADVRDIPGLVIPDGGANGSTSTLRTDKRQPFKNLDDLPRPAWDLVDVDAYRQAWVNTHGRFSWNMATSRGCPYRCNWCAKPVFGSQYAQRSPASVAAEVKYISDHVGPDHIWFADDIFGLTAGWIESLASELAVYGTRIPFMMQSRANLLTTTVVSALRKAGAEEVWIGAESGSQRILEAMDKATTIQNIRNATRNLKNAGIRVGWFIQLGYPGEEWEDILLTRNLIGEERPDDIGVSVSYPLPGTKFFDVVKQQLGPKTNWRDSADLAMMFNGTYTTPFYREIRNLLHDQVNGRSRTKLDADWLRLGAQQSTQRSEPYLETRLG